MKIDKQTVEQIAHLARLEITGQESEQLITDMNRILSFMDKLNEVDTSGVEPLIYMTDEVNVLREDKTQQAITHEEALQNAPRRDGKFFLVPKVIKK